MSSAINLNEAKDAVALAEAIRAHAATGQAVLLTREELERVAQELEGLVEEVGLLRDDVDNLTAQLESYNKSKAAKVRKSEASDD